MVVLVEQTLPKPGITADWQPVTPSINQDLTISPRENGQDYCTLSQGLRAFLQIRSLDGARIGVNVKRVRKANEL